MCTFAKESLTNLLIAMIRKKDGFQGERAVTLPPVIVEMQENDPLTSSLFITDIGYYPKAEHHHRIREKAIDQYVLIYCVDGKGFYVIGNKRYDVVTNQYFILPPFEPHEYGAVEGGQWTIYWLHFRGEHAAIYAEGAQRPQTINVTQHSRISVRINIFEEMMSTLHCSTGLEDLRYASSLLHYFLASMRFLERFRKSGDTSGNDRKQLLPYNNSHNIVDAAIHYMQENVEHRITLQDVLHYVGYSQSRFSAIFKKQTGRSPLAYFNRLKIDHACTLLKATDLKVNQICYKIGIEDPFYFSRLFSKAMGMSPTDYRQRGTVHVQE